MSDSNGTSLFADTFLVNSAYWKVNNGEPSDSLGNTYTPKNYVIAQIHAYANYNIREEYTKIEGEIAPIKGKVDIFTGGSVLRIYADDMLIYESPPISPTTYKIEFSKEIPPNTRILKIVGNNTQWASGDDLLLMDFILYE